MYTYHGLAAIAIYEKSHGGIANTRNENPTMEFVHISTDNSRNDNNGNSCDIIIFIIHN